MPDSLSLFRLTPKATTSPRPPPLHGYDFQYKPEMMLMTTGSHTRGGDIPQIFSTLLAIFRPP